VRAEVRALAAGLPLPESAATGTVAETIAGIARMVPELEAVAWAIVRDHESRALEQVSPEPGAREALEALAATGFPLAVWTNNARQVAANALARAGLAGFFSTLVTRDEAALKPDPAGLRLLRAAHPGRAVWVIGDSWIDGAAAQAGDAAFIGYGTDGAEFARRAVTPRVVLADLRELPVWLAAADGSARSDGGAGARRV
jgi:phosphoglycolate phosphatase